jgi:LacI family transcriptional regulator
VLNNSDHPVSARARRRVQATVRDLKYVPNGLARSLLTRETAAIGLLVPDVSNPYYAVILRGIEDVASAGGRAVILCNTDRRREKQHAYLRALLERRVDGLIVAGGAFTEDDLHIVRGLLPIVTIGRHPVPLPSVRVDNVAAAVDATRHLLSLGHRRIACLAGNSASLTAADRVDGYRRALADAGMPVRPEYVITEDFTADGGRRGAHRLMALDNPPTAIVAASDQMAIGALRALREMSLRVPADVSIVAFDDTPLASHAIPALTTVALPMYDLGRRAMEALLGLLDGERASSVVLPTALRLRESTGPPARIAAAIARDAGAPAGGPGVAAPGARVQ